ncbi:MAG: cation-translocating P-type ATPase, partial [Clostridia bacterium]|nr:cation-translocating P-type ATPase [Clostridia bacterium]
ILEERSIMGGRAAIDGLKKMQKSAALLINENGEKTEIAADKLKPGDLFFIRPGDGFPVDGTVVSGSSSVDQKSLTGEPEPVYVTEGTKVYAGTVNIDGTLTVRADKGYNDTSFSNIIKLLEQSEKMEIPESRLIDRFMRYYIPFILAIAAAVALINNDISRAVAILVVSCPCGQMLVSSAPMVAALSAATKRGILIKNSKFIEKIVDADAVVFDKTGTLTSGNLKLTEIVPIAEDCTPELALAICDALSSGSGHPVSCAVCSYADEIRKSQSLPVINISELRETHGIGMKAVFERSEEASSIPEGEIIEFGRYIPADDDRKYDFSEHGTVSVLTCGKEKRLLAALCFDDTVRADAGAAVKELQELGIEETVMLTGDRETSAKKIAAESGIDTVYAGLLPAGKYDRLLEIKGRRTGVIAVGDGINDALALREADVGIAMGAMGSDLAIQSADIALMNNRLDNIPFIISLAKNTRKIIYQNLIIAMLISAVMIVLSAFGIITAVFGAVFHNVGAFTVLINSSRLIRNGIDTASEDKE